MTPMLVLAGDLDRLGDSLIGTVGDWADSGLQAALLVIVVITVIRRVSLKAGIGALLGMVIALGLYNSRDSLAKIFEDEINDPAQSAPAFSRPSSSGEGSVS
ncbi:hypothetical protein LIX60_31260 [Streptomyces sp. S07_1.15]|uniref:hypothetical protein n=1 Tax=Streptomyces sp. S07_1.15 TaxID=2873925 RepID=UPI001D15BCFB|nr:hypothetical protein [Streptomyces sp. S07_1.15]MCC3655863.1 hypothetical protein [Streptomyces sp. S07_1.15]